MAVCAMQPMVAQTAEQFQIWDVGGLPNLGFSGRCHDVDCDRKHTIFFFFQYENPFSEAVLPTSRVVATSSYDFLLFLLV